MPSTINPPTITHLITIGDSLSDRGTFYDRRLFGFPLRLLAGIEDKSISPHGRFTNSFAWDDNLGAILASEFLIRRLKRIRKYSSSDISDSIITGDFRIHRQIHQDFNLADDSGIRYKGRDFIRNYNEGGLTSSNYKWRFTPNITLFFTRLLLSNLDNKRKELLADDLAFNVTLEQKQKTLIVEWSGANDLITVNKKPTLKEINQAISARLRNVRILKSQGYCHFILFNLPDLSLTPRFALRSQAEREEVSKICEEFNRKLAIECSKLQKQHPIGTIKVFDIESYFKEIYFNPGKYQLDRSLRDKPYILFKDKIPPKSKQAPAKGYMFWDDVHPTGAIHGLLANRVYDTYEKEYAFKAGRILSEHELFLQFQTRYNAKYYHDKHSLFGLLVRKRFEVNLRDPKGLIYQILNHALYENGKRTKSVLLELGWINQAGRVNFMMPALRHANQTLQNTRKHKI